MEPLRNHSDKYLSELRNRATTSHVYREHQLIGLEVAALLGDETHKALYMKLTKQFGKDKILTIAKDVASKNDVTNKGAYFMSVLFEKSNDRRGQKFYYKHLS